MSANIQFILEMGFSQSLAERAIKETGDVSIEAAMEWLIANPEPESNDDVQSREPVPDAGAVADVPQAAKSIRCDECNKLFTTPEQVEFHAAKTNHSQFSESTEEKKSLTEDEKKEQLNKIKELMKQKRREREEKERAEQLEREKKRIQSGKEMTQIRKKIEDDEIKKLAEERRREKEEEKKARQRVKEQIEQDKLARKMKAEMSSQPPAPAVQPQTQQPPAPAKEYKETRIQIRLTNGATLVQGFNVKEQLAAVRLYIELNRTDAATARDFRLQTNFPRKIFSEADYEKPLDTLGLVPSAVLIVSNV